MTRTPLPLLQFPDVRARITEEHWSRLTAEVERKARQIARLNYRLRRASASLRDAIDAVNTAVHLDDPQL
jgi:hypothetical protein